MSELTYSTSIGYEKGWLTPAYWAFMKLEQFWLSLTRRNAKFAYRGGELPYVIAMYNRTWATERCVEVAIARDAIARHKGEAILELGNVLAHYGDSGQVVVDKYEVAPGVRNIDAVEIPEDEKYGLVVSLSTMEHVGWDETPREPEKFLAAYERLYELLEPGGELVVTVPVDWNEWLDEQLGKDAIPADQIDWLVRTGRYIAWEESSKEAALAKKYGSPFRNANGLVVLTRRRPA
jgi:SAM-dependent methyltransferase